MAETDLFRGERYRVRHWRTDATPRTVVSFTTWLAKPGLDEDFSGAGFFIHRGINLIGIQSTDNDWFQHGEIARALAAVREATPGHQRIGYGGSMGGYAVINFADALDLHSLVAICPQVSVDPARAPFEDRWLSEARRISTAIRDPAAFWLIPIWLAIAA